MPISLHVMVGFAVQMIALAAFGIYFVFSGVFGREAVYQLLAAMVVVWIIRFAFRRLVPARCPVPSCGGKAYCKGSRPIFYQCSKCGEVRQTRVFEGSTVGNRPPWQSK